MDLRLFRMGQLKLVIAAICSLITLGDCCFGQTWSLTGAPTNEEWQALACSADASKLLAVSQRNIFTSTNSGTTWTPVNPPSSLDTWHAATASADGSVMIAGGFGGLYVSTNSGIDWELNTSAPQNVWYWSAACSADGTKAIAAAYYDIDVGSPQLLYLSQDSGTTWTPASAPSNNWSAVASSADGTKLIALAFNGPIFRSTDSGSTWTSNNIVGYWRSVACTADGTKAIAVASPGDVYISTNSGLSWNLHFVPDAGIGFGSVATSADGVRLLAVGFENGSPICVSTNSGITWNKQTNAPAIVIWNAVGSSADGFTIFAGTYGLTGNDNAGGIYELKKMHSPLLNLGIANTNVDVSWAVSSTDFVLQNSPDLSNWFDTTNVPTLNFSNLKSEVILPLCTTNDFYRLKTP